MAASRSEIVRLASTIGELTAELNDYFVAEKLATPSFSSDAASDIPLPPDISAVRIQLLEATSELHDLIMGPLRYLTHLTSPMHNVLTSLQFIHRYDIAAKVDVGEKVEYEELAQRCGVDIEDIRRFLRLSIAFHIFEEPEENMVKHSAVSKCLIDFPFANQWVGHFCDEVWPSSTRTVDAISRWPASQEPHETPFALANPTNKGVFDFLQANPAKFKRFTEGMRFLQMAPEFSHEHLLRDLEWDREHVPDLMVDIGGADGSIAAAILRRFNTVKCVVQDLEDVMKSARVPEDLKERLHFQAHDMFTEQPVKNGDVYFLRSTLHDFGDKFAIQILRSLIPALKDGARIIVNEVCVAAPNALSYYQARLLRGYDMTMKQLFNSKERTAQEWEQLFKVADHRFRLRRITCSLGSILSVIEVEWIKDETPHSVTLH